MITSAMSYPEDNISERFPSCRLYNISPSSSVYSLSLGGDDVDTLLRGGQSKFLFELLHTVERSFSGHENNC